MEQQIDVFLSPPPLLLLSIKWINKKIKLKKKRLREDGPVKPQIKNKEGKKWHLSLLACEESSFSPGSSFFASYILKEKTYVIKNNIFLKKEKLSLSLCASPHLLRCLCRKPQLNEHIPRVRDKCNSKWTGYLVIGQFSAGGNNSEQGLWGAQRCKEGECQKVKGFLVRGSKEGMKEMYLMKYQPVKSRKKQTNIFNCWGIHTELKQDNGFIYRWPMVHVGAG